MPSPQLIDRALAAIGRRWADYEYFFDHLRSPSWIPGLKGAGFFSSPPKPIEDRDSIRFPVWPESRYLTRMAGKSPEAAELVAEIIEGVPGTENPRVLEDFADAALSMPPAIAARLTDNAKIWIESPHHLLLPDKLGELINHLATGGQIDDALRLARSVLAILPYDQMSAGIDPSETQTPHLTPQPRFDSWQYGRILDLNLPVLVQAGGRQTLSLLCDLLEEAVQISNRDLTGGKPNDYSFIWFPQIEEGGPSYHNDVRSNLISAVRSTSITLAESDPTILPTIISDLESREWHIFRRVSLHLLRLFSDSMPNLVVERLTDPSLVESIGLYHEFWLLAADGVKQLPIEKRDQLFAMIQAGPDLEGIGQRVRDGEIEPLTDEQLGLRARHWKFRRLSMLSESLPTEALSEYELLREEFGDIERPDLLAGPVQIVRGDVSPRSPDEIAEMTEDQLIDYMSKWRPSGQWSSESYWGLRGAIEKAVSLAPNRFSQMVNRFREVDPTYIGGLLQGFKEAIKSQQEFPWDNIVSFALWIVDQPHELPEQPIVDEELDSDLSSVRKRLADLLADGFGSQVTGIPDRFRSQVWSVLEKLTEDSDPAWSGELHAGSARMDPAILSINSVRGGAMHAVIRYSLWVARSLQSSMSGGQQLDQGFDFMPEVQKVLDQHLDPTIDSSPAIRSVYGQYLPWLVSLDHRWVSANIDRIFPSNESSTELWEAAWNAYIVFNSVYDNVYPLVREEYARAIGLLGTARQDWTTGYPDERLADHLMALYWRGHVKLGEDDRLLERFFEGSSAGLRASALGFVGRLLEDEAIEPPDVPDDRLKLLWEYRLAYLDSTGAGLDESDELTTFGRWFASGKLAPEWLLDQLIEALRRVKRVQNDRTVVEQLEALSASYPSRTVEALRLLVEGTAETWSISLWEEAARRLLGRVISSGEEPARSAAINLVHVLGARGHPGFRDLLSP